MPVLIGIVVAVGAGLYLFLRQRKAASGAATPAATPQPIVLAGNNGGGIPSGLLYALLQNQQQSPATVAAGGGGTTPPPGPGGTTAPTTNQGFSIAPGTRQSGVVPNIRGMTFSQAITALQNAGYGISSASYNSQNITQAQAAQFANSRVVSYTPHGNTVSIGLW